MTESKWNFYLPTSLVYGPALTFIILTKQNKNKNGKTISGLIFFKRNSYQNMIYFIPEKSTFEQLDFI